MAVTVSILAQALPGLEMELAALEREFSTIENSAIEQMNGKRLDEGDKHEQAFAYETFERHAHRMVKFVRAALEAAGLDAHLKEFSAGWVAFAKNVSKMDRAYWHDGLASPTLEYLRNELDTIRLLGAAGRSPLEEVTAKRLRDTLEAMPHLLHTRGVVPEKEKDIQEVMDDYLSVAFIGDYVRHPRISGVLKNFDADGGIRTIRTAIEFKLARTHSEMARAVSGIFEDTAGYRGSLDWTNFYSVILQTEPFRSGAQFRADIQRAGALQWEAIVVHGWGAAHSSRRSQSRSVLRPRSRNSRARVARQRRARGDARSQ